ncbi:MAG: hypothetical protein EA379_10125 [Phycisphaerales bacterium]|nr:MAG: hypothetical protein EA379_10125 [Phycisphaerales bacterium]
MATKKTSRKTTKKAPGKKAPRMSASAARAEGAAKQKRMREAAKSDEAVHVGTVVRGDGKRVRVTVPKDDAPAPKASEKKARGAKRPKAKDAKPTPRKRVSLLDAAATVLADAKAPMQAKAIVEAVVERGLWTPGAGKTPHATLYAAMTREIADKGAASRFRKVDRGQFASGDAR